MNTVPSIASTKTKVSAKAWYLLFFVWIIATSGTLVSLFFSEIVQLPVCVLCWYQRIALYPLVIMLPLALFPYDVRIIRFISPLIIFGWFTALFHVLVVAGMIPESAQPCVQGIPCSEVHFTLFGFLNIPVMSLLTFSLIGLLLFLSKKQYTRNNNE
jgi:disulfide bond formation protein DsbB